jgi:hypothetical protein
MTIKGFGERLYFEMSGEMNRAIWSAPPPEPAGTTNSTGLLGSQASAILIEKINKVKKQTKATIILNLRASLFIVSLLDS